MLEQDGLEKALELHEKGYNLLLWVNRSLQSGARIFEDEHDKMERVEVARRWLEKNARSIPPRARPANDDVALFANLFTSYLQTSFEAAKDLRGPGCSCFNWCRIISEAATTMRPRNPRKEDMAAAQSIKDRMLKHLAAQAGIDIAPSRLGRLRRQDPDLDRDAAQVAWGQELIRRTRFSSQGPAVLALWREFTWQDGKPLKRKPMQAKDFIAAERRILHRLRSQQDEAGAGTDAA